MDQIYPDVSLVPMLLKLASSGGLDYHLFTNNFTPSLAAVLANFTEAAWGGYSVQNVLAAAFATSGVNSHLGYISAPPVWFLNTSGSAQNAYGFFVTDHGTGNLYTCARFDLAPISIPNGGSYPVTPLLATYSGLAS